MQLAILTHCAYHRGIGWNNCMVIGRGSTVSGLMGNGVYVFAGRGVMPSMLRLWTIIEEDNMKMKPVHPGEILVEEFLVPMGISQYRLAKEIHVPLRRVNEIALGRRGISADTALRFARFFGTSPEVWQNLQSQYEMDVARNSIWKDIKSTIKPALGRVACL